MKTYARIVDKIVVEIIKTDGDISKMFHPDLVWVDVTNADGIEEGWIMEGEVLSPPALPSVSIIKSAKWDAIKAERDHRIQSGGYEVGGKWYHSDTFSRTQQIGLVMMGTSMPSGIQWKTMDETFVEMTPDLALQVFQAAAENDQAVFSAAETHKVAMESSADPGAYDFSTGWPEVFRL